jgi:hypothetical protein
VQYGAPAAINPIYISDTRYAFGKYLFHFVMRAARVAPQAIPRYSAAAKTGRENCHSFALMQAMQRGVNPSRLDAITPKNSMSAGQYSPQHMQRFSSPSSVTVLTEE